MTRPVALKRIRALAGDSARVSFSRHAEQRLGQRGITAREVFGVLHQGRITEEPALDLKGCWRCTMTRFAAGEDVVVVVAICGDRLVVVTMFQE